MTQINLNTYISKLPSETKYTAFDGLQWEGKKIADIMLSVRHKIKMHTDNEIEDWFILDIIKDNYIVASEDIRLSDEDINKINWFDIYNGCKVSPDVPKANSYLISIVKHLLSDSSLETVEYQQIEKLGLNKIKIGSLENCYCYNTGEKLILHESIRDNDISERIKFRQSDWVLKEDTENYSEEEATEGIIKAISLNKRVGLPVLTFTIAGFLKSLYRECGIPPKFILYICGRKGRKKTPYISLMSPIFNKIDNYSKLILQFNSSSYSVDNLVNNYSDFIVVLDNVYLSEDNDINRRIKKTFEEAVQIIGDDINKSKAGKQYQPSSSIIATGENDGIGNPSTIGRYLTIPFGDILSTRKKEIILSECQNEPLLISTFYYYLLQYVIDNITEIKAGIHVLLQDFREISSSLQFINSKLRDMYLVLLTSYMIFLNYCEDKNFMSNKEVICLKENFSSQLLELLRNHSETIKEKETKETLATYDFVQLIKYWYINDMYDMAKDENDKQLENREALIYKDCLCLRTKPLIRKINKSFPDDKIRDKDFTAQLVAKGMLESDSDKNGKKIKGLRFMVIPLSKLK